VNKLEAPKSYRQQRRMKLVRCIFLVLNKRTKYCKKKKRRHNCTKYCKKKRQEDKNEIGAMHFFRWNLFG